MPIIDADVLARLAVEPGTPALAAIVRAFGPGVLRADGTLDPGVRDPSAAAFGFGRRICPGRHMALSSVWHAIASILRVYNIEKAKRPDGTVIEPVREYKSSLL